MLHVSSTELCYLFFFPTTTAVRMHYRYDALTPRNRSWTVNVRHSHTTTVMMIRRPMRALLGAVGEGTTSSIYLSPLSPLEATRSSVVHGPERMQVTHRLYFFFLKPFESLSPPYISHIVPPAFGFFPGGGTDRTCRTSRPRKIIPRRVEFASRREISTQVVRKILFYIFEFFVRGVVRLRLSYIAYITFIR